MDGCRAALLAEVRAVSRPGTRLRALAARVCSEKTMERLIDPVIGDLQAEYTPSERIALEAAMARATYWLYRVREGESVVRSAGTARGAPQLE